MELSASRRRVREINGPTPHSVGVIARRLSRHPPEHYILERRKRDEERERADTVVSQAHRTDLKNIWEAATDKKILKNTIQRKVDGLLKFQKHTLEERRERLRDLLQTEEEEYMAEAASKKETVLERQARMRERARSLREKREKERLALVEDKLDQRWKSQCEELRSMQSKCKEEQIYKSRSELLRLRDEERKRDAQREEMYAKLWEKDCLAKSKREEMETALRLERNKETLDLLNTQTAARAKEREDLKKLQDKEAELLREEASLRAMEETKLLQEKKRKQEETRSVLDFSLKLKMQKRARHIQEELALDMKILEQLLAESSNEAMGNLQRKDQLREEIRQYQQYLDDQAKLEKKREEELEIVVNAEVERQWSRRLEQWKKEKEARKKLMKDVFDTRKKQIGEKLAQIAQEKAEIEKERKKLIKLYKEHKELEKTQLEEKQQATLAHKQDLIDQMKHIELVKQLEKQKIQEEDNLCKEAEAIYQRRVQNALSKMKNADHPNIF